MTIRRPAPPQARQQNGTYARRVITEPASDARRGLVSGDAVVPRRVSGRRSAHRPIGSMGSGRAGTSALTGIGRPPGPRGNGPAGRGPRRPPTGPCRRSDGVAATSWPPRRRRPTCSVPATARGPSGSTIARPSASHRSRPSCRDFDRTVGIRRSDGGIRRMRREPTGCGTARRPRTDLCRRRRTRPSSGAERGPGHGRRGVKDRRKMSRWDVEIARAAPPPR